MNTNTERQKSRAAKTRRLIVYFAAWPAIVAMIAVGAYIANFFDRPISSETGDWGTFGDFLGGIVNPVTGLVTIVLLVLTLRSQQDELEEQRRQLAKQAFEQSFFGWTSSYRELISGLQFGSGTELDPRLTGVIALHEILRLGRAPSNEETHSLITKMQSVDATEQEEIRATHRSSTVAWWERCFVSNEPQLGALIRTLYSLLRWVDSHPNVSWVEKWDAVSIIRARLSGPELRVIYFNGFLHDGKKFNAYVQRYALLDNLPLSGHNRVILAYSLGLHPFEEASFDSNLARSALLESGEVKPIAETSGPA
jgi:uncharacterized membrane protein